MLQTVLPLLMFPVSFQYFLPHQMLLYQYWYCDSLCLFPSLLLKFLYGMPYTTVLQTQTYSGDYFRLFQNSTVGSLKSVRIT